MKNIIELMKVLCAFSLVGLFLLMLPACEGVSDRNDLLVDIGVSQGVIRYVEAGSTPAADAQRRESLIAALSVARQFVQSDEYFSSLNWVDGFFRLMDWDSLSVADQILLSQVIDLVRQEIAGRVGDAEVRVYLGRVIDVAINTASKL